MQKIQNKVSFKINVGTNYRCEYHSFIVDSINDILGYKMSFHKNQFDRDSKTEWVTIPISKNHIERITIVAQFED